MASRLTEVIMDCADLDVMAKFWGAALGYEPTGSGDGWLGIGTAERPDSLEDLAPAPPAPIIAFVLVPEPKVRKNRTHIDLTPYDCTQAEEVERLVALGARHADVGQRDVAWVVLQDPEGNEFCVMPGTESA